MNLENAVKYLAVLEGKPEEQVMRALRGLGSELTPEEKNLIYVYLFPQPLLDREIIPKIQTYRKEKKSERGFLEANLGETLILLGAYRGRQYGKYIKHLLHSFIESSDKMYVLDGQGICSCGLCDKPLWEHTAWLNECDKNPSFGEQNRREFLAYGCPGSSQTLCTNCLIQLRNLHELLIVIEGRNYLGWGKPTKIGLSPWKS